MADYIDKNIITQAYLHLDIPDLSDDELTLLKEQLNMFVRSRTDFFLYSEAEISIEFREGSLKVYATILGTIGALYTGVAQYSDFRVSSQLLYNDVKRLSDYIVAESLYITKARHKETTHIEARVGVIGSIQKINTTLSSIIKMNGQKPVHEMSKKIIEANNEIKKLFSNLKNENDRELVANGILSIAKQISSEPIQTKTEANSDNRVEILKYKKSRIILISTVSSVINK